MTKCNVHGAVFLGMVLTVTLIWYITGQHTVYRYADILFSGTMATLLFGLILIIVNSSRKHYYRYVTDNYWKKARAETTEEFEKKSAERRRHAGYGKYFVSAGLTGLIICAVLSVVYPV
ncbi:MAG: hypothetical protein ACQEQ4_02360 [Fibrobacterota bacterium]